MTRRRPIETLYEAFLKKAPKQSRSRKVVEAILAAAAERLSAGDEAALTVQDVAVRAGVGIGSLYDYFRDRRSLLAGLTAKITEDNLRTFEAVLERTHELELRPAVEAIVDHAFATYLPPGEGGRRLPRAILRIAHQIGLMPTLAQSLNVFAESFGAALRKRTDVDPAIDPMTAAYVLTSSLMGIMHTLVWDDEPPLPLEVIRRGAVALAVDHLEAGRRRSGSHDTP
jgi:AcrR family transcriptional regulator